MVQRKASSLRTELLSHSSLHGRSHRAYNGPLSQEVVSEYLGRARIDGLAVRTCPEGFENISSCDFARNHSLND